jgi:hypothetical protein
MEIDYRTVKNILIKPSRPLAVNHICYPPQANAQPKVAKGVSSPSLPLDEISG